MNPALCRLLGPTAVDHCASAYLTRSVGDEGAPPPDLVRRARGAGAPAQRAPPQRCRCRARARAPWERMGAPDARGVRRGHVLVMRGATAREKTQRAPAGPRFPRRRCAALRCARTHARQLPLTPRCASPARTPSPPQVVSRGNVLEVHRVIVERAGEAEGEGRAGAAGAVDSVLGARLECVLQQELSGAPHALRVLRRREGSDRNGRDAIVLSFAEAKVAVAEYDPHSDLLRVSSLHQFEGKDTTWMRAGAQLSQRDAALGPSLAADPKGRCAAAIVHRTSLVLLRAAGDQFGLSTRERRRLGTGRCAAIATSSMVALQSLGVTRLRHAAFLHGYAEPVLLMLHETRTTWAGRYSLVHDTCALSAVSVDLVSGRHVPIWQVESLPSDAYAISAVRAPFGGALVLTPNTLIYASQTATVALALNRASHWAPRGAAGPPERAGFSMELDAAHVAWVERDRCLLFAKTGDIATVSLGRDGRGQPRLTVRRVGAAPLSAGACVLSGHGARLLFMSSRLGDSLLVQCYDKTKDSATPAKGAAGDGGETDGAPSAKRARLNGDAGDDDEEGGDLGGGALAADNEEQALAEMLKGTGSADGTGAAELSFLVRDSMLSVAPLRHVAVCPDACAPEGADGRQVVIACAGHGKNGALAVLQRGVRPTAITEVGLPGVAAIWAASGRLGSGLGSSGGEQGGKGDAPASTEHHSHLVMDMGGHTIVLATGEEMEEISDSSPFFTEGSTLAAGDVLGGAAFLQVHAGGVQAASSREILCNASLAKALPGGAEDGAEDGVKIETASVADPFVLVAGGGRAALGRVATDKNDGSATVDFKAAPAVADATATAIFRADRGTWLRSWVAAATGDDSVEHVCAAATPQGALRVYALPAWRLLFEAAQLADAAPLLSNALADDGAEARVHERTDEGIADEAVAAAAAAASVALDKPDHDVVELSLFAFERKQPFLALRLSDGTLAAYRAFSGASGERPPLGFRRVALVALPAQPAAQASRTLVPFARMGSPPQNGLFVCGPEAQWLVEHRGLLTPHQHTPFLTTPSSEGSEQEQPAAADRPTPGVLAFAPFNNVNCPAGMVFAEALNLVVASLPPRAYGLDMPARKAALRQTPISVSPLPGGKLAAVVCSSTVPPERRPPPPPPPVQHKMGERTEYDERPVLFDPSEEHCVALVDLTTLQQKFTFALEPCEQATDVEVALLGGDTEPLVCVSTAYLPGEDVQAKGRIVLLRVLTIQDGQDNPDAGLHVGAPYLHLVCAREVRSAVVCVKELAGNLIASAGAKVTVHQWQPAESTLNQVSFFDLPTGAAAVAVVKNFVLLCDALKSCYFIRWKEEKKEMGLLSKDFDKVDAVTGEFLIDGSALAMLECDVWGDALLLAYMPQSAQSWQGQRLIPRGRCHLGAHALHACRLPLPKGASGKSRLGALLATREGALLAVAPIAEEAHKRLLRLHGELCDQLRHPLGLHPRAFRAPRRLRQRLATEILDADTLARLDERGARAAGDAAASAGFQDRSGALAEVRQVSPAALAAAL